MISKNDVSIFCWCFFLFWICAVSGIWQSSNGFPKKIIITNNTDFMIGHKWCSDTSSEIKCFSLSDIGKFQYEIDENESDLIDEYNDRIYTNILLSISFVAIGTLPGICLMLYNKYKN